MVRAYTGPLSPYVSEHFRVSYAFVSLSHPSGVLHQHQCYTSQYSPALRRRVLPPAALTRIDASLGLYMQTTLPFPA